MPGATDYWWQTVTMPDTVNGNNSRAFDVPRGAKTATFIFPDLTGSGTQKIQILTPKASDQSPDVWTDLQAVIFATGSVIGQMTLAGFQENQAYAIPIQGLGTATMRFVSSVTQGAILDAFTIYVLWGVDR